MAYLAADAHTLLAQLVLEVRELRAELRAYRQGEASGADAALVAAVFAVAGPREFAVRELVDMARRPGVPEAALRALLGERSAKAIGKLLHAAAGQPCATTGLVLVRASVGRLGATWRVSHPRKAANA